MKKAIPLAILCIVLTASIAGCIGEAENSGSQGASSNNGPSPPCCAFEENSGAEWEDVPVIGWFVEKLA